MNKSFFSGTRKFVFTLASVAFIVLLLSSCGNNGQDSQNASKGKDKKEAVDKKTKVERLNEKIKSNPENASLYHKRAQHYLESGNINKALSDINNAISLGKSNKEDYMITLSDIYFAMGQPQKTKQTLESILIDNPNHLEALLKMANLHFYRESYDQAFGFLNKARETAPNDQRIYFISGMINKEKEEYSKAKRDFHRATEINQDFFDAWIQLGLLAAREGKSTAVDYYQNALDARPGSEEALYNLGMYYQEKGQIEKAINTYNQLLDNNAESEKGYYNLGYIYLTQTGDYQKAEQNFRQVLDINPSNIDAVYNLGSALEQQGKYEEARKQFKKTLDIQENYQLGIKGLNRLDQKTK
ncbi:MAG: tetratricopeptide repeat protein [Bacteroidales bacterium]|nr:tetratricopeptide repeat protein [Bacteroidales bacterium]